MTLIIAGAPSAIQKALVVRVLFQRLSLVREGLSQTPHSQSFPPPKARGAWGPRGGLPLQKEKDKERRSKKKEKA